MWIVLVLLLITNAVTIGLLWWLWREQGAERPYDREVLQALARQNAGSQRGTRRVLTIEVLNPVQLAGTRAGKVVGFGASFVPGFTRRVVYEQMLRELRKQLASEGVVADVRLHRLDLSTAVTPAESMPSQVTDDAMLEEQVLAATATTAPTTAPSAPAVEAPTEFVPQLPAPHEDPYPFYKQTEALFDPPAEG